MTLRIGKVDEVVRGTMTHEMERREAALQAVMSHLGWTLEDIEADPEKRERVVQVRRIRPLSDAEGRRVTRALDLGESPAMLVPRGETAITLDGIEVWRGWWEWSHYTAEWHEEPLVAWMAEALTPPAEAPSSSALPSPER